MAAARTLNFAIVGSRDFPHLISVWNLVMFLLPSNARVVSGGARGVDRVAEKAAIKRGLPRPLIFKPDWSTGRGAGFARNKIIIEESDIVIAFWHNRSRGTADSIGHAKRLGKKIYVFEYLDNKLVRCYNY